MSSINRHSDLVAWKKSMDLVEMVYQLTKQFPKEEVYGLTSQLRRSAVSIPSNIAEGYGRSGRREFAHCLSIALGSLAEVETQIEIAQRLGYIGSDEAAGFLGLSAETRRVIVGLMNALEKHVAATAS
jgi:four helix bundle protein